MATAARTQIWGIWSTCLKFRPFGKSYNYVSLFVKFRKFLKHGLNKSLKIFRNVGEKYSEMPGALVKGVKGRHD